MCMCQVQLRPAWWSTHRAPCRAEVLGTGGWVWRPCVGLNPNGLPANSTTFVFPSYHPSLILWQGPQCQACHRHPASNPPTLRHLTDAATMAWPGPWMEVVVWAWNWVSQLENLYLRFMVQAWGWIVYITKCLVQRGLQCLKKTLCSKANNTAWPTLDQWCLSREMPCPPSLRNSEHQRVVYVQEGGGISGRTRVCTNACIRYSCKAAGCYWQIWGLTDPLGQEGSSLMCLPGLTYWFLGFFRRMHFTISQLENFKHTVKQKKKIIPQIPTSEITVNVLVSICQIFSHMYV